MERNYAGTEYKPALDFTKSKITGDIKAEAERLLNIQAPPEHGSIFELLLEQVKIVDFREHAGLKNANDRLTRKHIVVIVIEELLNTAVVNNWGICKNNSSIFLFNGAYWLKIDSCDFETFLGQVAIKMGVEKIEAKYHQFKKELFDQFLSDANLTKPKPPAGVILINFQNGTLEICSSGKKFRPHKREDFLTYILDFEYNPDLSSPIFAAFLDKVQPEKERQNIIAEFLSYVFIRTSDLKLEKALLLYGSGANGKSVLFEIVNALLGHTNVSTYSLQTLTDVERGGPYRANIENKLANYASEINGKLETSMFKAMVSGEPIEVKALYHAPFQITNYAKLIFNCNELPKDVEQTHAYFRRFLIVPFDVTIPEQEQDKELSSKIIKNELPGVFNWVMSGLARLLLQKKFTDCESVRKQTEKYQRESDSVRMFLDDEAYIKSDDLSKPLKDLFKEYQEYCSSGGYRFCSIRTFGERVRNCGFESQKKNIGQVVFIKKEIL